MLPHRRRFIIMEKICGIYKITNPKGKIYIGESISCLKRKERYAGLHCKEQPKIYRSILKYGWDAHKFEIIQVCGEKELNQLEKYYVDLYQTFNSKHGLNLREGGGNHGSLSNETKRRMSIGQKKRKRVPFTEKAKQKMSNSAKGNLSRAKIVLNIETGIYYDSILKASESIGIIHGTLTSQLRSNTKNKKFIYA